jgi:hypothetical protein
LEWQGFPVGSGFKSPASGTKGEPCIHWGAPSLTDKIAAWILINKTFTQNRSFHNFGKMRMNQIHEKIQNTPIRAGVIPQKTDPLDEYGLFFLSNKGFKGIGRSRSLREGRDCFSYCFFAGHESG